MKFDPTQLDASKPFDYLIRLSNAVEATDTELVGVVTELNAAAVVARKLAAERRGAQVGNPAPDGYATFGELAGLRERLGEATRVLSQAADGLRELERRLGADARQLAGLPPRNPTTRGS